MKQIRKPKMIPIQYGTK